MRKAPVPAGVSDSGPYGGETKPAVGVLPGECLPWPVLARRGNAYRGGDPGGLEETQVRDTRALSAGGQTQDDLLRSRLPKFFSHTQSKLPILPALPSSSSADRRPEEGRGREAATAALRLSEQCVQGGVYGLHSNLHRNGKGQLPGAARNPGTRELPTNRMIRAAVPALALRRRILAVGRARDSPEAGVSRARSGDRRSACWRKLKVKAELAGKKVKCPHCAAAVEVPNPQAGPPDAPGRTTA